MSTKIEIDAKKLIGDCNRISKEYRQAILNSMDDHLDLIRTNAETIYIIPDRYPNLPIKGKYKKQKTDSQKLTSRSGSLKKMIRTGKGSWKKGSSTHYADGPAVQAKNRTISKNTTAEAYEGTISYNIKNAGAISSRQNAQALRMRFFHDTKKGIRGKSRPFLTIAASNLNLTHIEELAKKRLSAIGVL